MDRTDMNTILSARINSALERRGSRIALVAGETALSGDELLSRSVELAATIRALGVNPGDIVGIVVDRSEQSIVTMLALLHLRCAYLPLDSTSPEPWREHLLKLARAHLLTRSNQEYEVRQPEPPPPDHVGENSRLAYVMGTSGTTGLPKAVPVSEASLLHYCDAFADRIGRPAALAGTRMASVTTLAADLGNTMVFPALLFGAELHLVPEQTARDPQRFATYLRTHEIDALKVVPTHLRALLEGGLTDLPARLLVVGGESFDLDLLEQLERHACRCAVFNHYGPTEATIGVAMRRVETSPGSANRLRAAGHRTVPVGTALGATELRIVDERLEPCARGQIGELVIRGPGVAQGYPGNAAETGQRFITAKWSCGEPVFRSGDRARLTPAGELELFGRADRQLKVRGHRVEAAGVEAELRAHPGVHDASVGLRQLGDLGRALVAWAHADDNVDEPRLREFLRARLPESMVPSRIVVVPELLRTPNGKVDHRALPDPLVQRATVNGRDIGEDAASQIFAEVLHLPPQAVHDDFFRLGGHSLAALRVIDRLREEHGLEVAVADFFATPHPTEIMRVARPVTTAAPNPPARGLSPQVRALWTHVQMSPHDTAYEIPLRLRVAGPVDAERIRSALTDIATRHEALRTRFTHEGGEPVAVVDPTPRSTLAFDHAALDLESGPVMRARVTETGHDEHLVDLVVHHIVFDGVSHSVLARELVSLLSGERLEPITVAHPHGHHVQYREVLPLGEGARARLGLQTWQPFSDAPARCHEQQLPTGVWPLVESRAAELNTTPFTMVAAAWALVLSQQDGEHAVTIGTPADLRAGSAEANAVGYHVNVVVLEAEIEPDETIRELVAHTHRAVGLALASRDIPYVDRVTEQRAATGTPPTRTLLTIERLEHVVGTNVQIRTEPVPAPRPMLGVDVCVLVGDDSASLQIHHREDVCPQWRARCLGDQLSHVLRQIVADPDAPVASVDILPSAWADRMLEWSHGPAVHQLERWGAPRFLDRAAERPSTGALAWPGGGWTRSKLAEEIERMARTLRDRGLGPGHVVAISAPPSPALVVAWHAAQLLGAAVIALDPDWPQHRRDVAAESAQAAVRINARDGLTLLVEGRALATPAHPHDLAYLVLTSGSTGAPKTVAIQRAALANELSWFAAEFPIGEDDRVLAHTSPGFDVSVWEVLGPLAWGACLVFPSINRRNDVPHLTEVLRLHDVTVTQTVPSLLEALLDQDDLDWSRPRLILCGGEEMPVSLASAVAGRLPGAMLVNVYGPSETTIDATFWRVDPSSIAGGRVPIGRPIAGARAYVLDDRLRLLPPGAFGQLAIGGNAVGLGYPNDPAETSRRFVPDPFVAEPGARLYLTGDRARWNGDGELEFGGRQDNQVKIRGNRIELEEVEAALRALPFVEDAVVHPVGVGTPEAHLAALVVPADRGPLTVQALHSGVAEVLPSYLVPSAFGLVESLPRRANGKVARDALPLDALQTPTTRTEWRTAMEAKVGRVWADLLGHEALKPDLSFFASGGTSLLIPALRTRLSQEVGATLSVPELFEHSTIRAQAIALERKAERRDAHRCRIRARQVAQAGHRRSTSAGERMTENDFDTAIAVTGMACRFPGAPDVRTYWRNLCAGVDAIQHFDLTELRGSGLCGELLDHRSFVPACAPVPDPYAFDEAHFGVPPAAARALDPQQRVFIECAWTALEASGALVSERAAVAVFAGCSDTTYRSSPQQGDGGQGGSLAFDISTSSDYLATRTAYLLGLRGPAVTVRTACSTSLVAIHLAVQSLLMNECDFAVAGGAAIRHPLRRGHVYEPGGIYSADGHCRPYDRLASGIVSGDGAGAVVLRRLADAVRGGDHVHAVIRGSAINNDGAAKASFAAPSVEGQVEVALTALEVAGVDPATIGFVEGHGTATPLGDPIEVEALSRLWGKNSARTVPCVLGSVKSNIGHLDAAAGVASFIKACLAVEHGRIPGTLNYSAPNPHSSLAESVFVVSTETTDWHEDGPRRASVHSLGLGGTNAHVVLEQALVPAEGPGEQSAVPVVLPLSTRRLETLGAYAGAVAEELETSELDIAVVARTLQDSRVAELYRRVVVGSDRGQLARALRSLECTFRPAADRPRVVLAFPGDGKRVRGALRELGRHLPPVAEVLRDSAAHLRSRWGVDLAALEVESSARGVLPAIVAQGLALHAGLEAFGAGGDVVLGLSLGELTAAAASGLISRTEALDLAMSREKAFRAVVPSGALAVGVASGALADRLPPGIELSIVNSPHRSVVSGPVDALARFADELAADGTPVHRLDVISAVHSSLLDPVLDDFRRAAALLAPQQPTRTLLSTVGPTEVDERLAADPDHWARQLREPIRFDTAIRTAVSGHGHAVVVDVGPSGGLGTAIREIVGDDARAVASLSRQSEDVSELEAFGAALGQLWEAGVPIDWSAWPRRASRRTVLPVPPLVRTVHAPDVPITHQPMTARPGRVALWSRGWRRVHPAAASEGAQRIAVLTGADPLGEVLAEGLAERGHDVEVLTGLTGEHDLVVDARALGVSDGPATAAAFLEIAAATARTPSRLVVLTRGAFDILGTESVSTAAAAVAASALVVAQEHGLALTCLDVDATVDVDVLERILLTKPTGTLLGMRGRSVWSPVVDEVDRSPSALPDMRTGVYVITGGLGRFGRWVGRWLAEHGCRDLFLIGRSGLDVPEAEGVLRADAVAAMRVAGARVTVIQADLTDHAAITRALDEAHRAGKVTILHLAGAPNAVSAGTPLDDLRKSGLKHAMEEQWAAKVAGAEALLDWTRQHPDARCVTFSSNAAVLGGPGLAAYAAANAALDALAVQAGDREGLSWCSIGWDGWRLPEDPADVAPSALEEFALRGDEPWQALRNALAADRCHVVVAKGDFSTRHQTWVESPNPAPQPAEVHIPVSAAGVDDVVTAVRRIWAEVFGRAAPHDDADLFKEGGDSLVAMRIRNRLERELDCDVSLQEVIQNRTVAGLSALVRKRAAASDQPVATSNETIRGRI